MIQLTIEGEKYLIPTADELTAEQYLAFNASKRHAIDYIALTTGLNRIDLLRVHSKTIDKVVFLLGEICDPFQTENMLEPAAAEFYKKHGLGSVKLDNVGHRMLFEAKLKSNPKDGELVLFTLSMALQPTCYDFDLINKHVEHLKTLAYKAVLPNGTFFFKKFLAGLDSAKNLYKSYQIDMPTAMRILKKRRALLSYKITLRLLNLYEFAMLLKYRLTRLIR